MNCHGKNDHNGQEGSGKKSHWSHLLMMVLCCGAPALVLLLLPVVAKVGSPETAKVLAGVAPFLCPLIMVLMIPMMFKGNKSDRGNNG